MAFLFCTKCLYDTRGGTVNLWFGGDYWDNSYILHMAKKELEVAALLICLRDCTSLNLFTSRVPAEDGLLFGKNNFCLVSHSNCGSLPWSQTQYFTANKGVRMFQMRLKISFDGI